MTSIQHPLRVRNLMTALASVAALSISGMAHANGPAIFSEADLKLGEQLIVQGKCSQCHAGRTGGDGSSIYNPQGRINTPSALRGMVEQCNTMLSLQMFPEEVTAVAAVLNRDHYKFK